jgi:mRNA interferase MazF
MNTYRQRDIALARFPFSDLSSQKVRPVLVLSNDEYNRRSADVLVCGLTTNLRPVPYSVIIDVTDVEQPGTLRHRSKIKADTISSLEQSILMHSIARLKLPIFRRVVAEITDLINPPAAPVDHQRA